MRNLGDKGINGTNFFSAAYHCFFIPGLHLLNHRYRDTNYLWKQLAKGLSK